MLDVRRFRDRYVFPDRPAAFRSQVSLGRTGRKKRRFPFDNGKVGFFTRYTDNGPIIPGFVELGKGKTGEIWTIPNEIVRMVHIHHELV